MQTNCKYCGRVVEWRKNKTGKNYLAEASPIYNENGRHIKTIWPAHRCTVDAAERSAIDEQAKRDKDAAIERGEIVVGQHVVVAKGRKYPIGTAGVITWIAREVDQFGVIKARVQTVDGAQFYINRANLEVKPT